MNVEKSGEERIIRSHLQREKAGKLERMRRLNLFARKGQIVFAGSSLMEQFPINEFLLDYDLPYVIYNRGIGGYTTAEMMDALQEMVFDLEPRYLFLNIGTNDLNGSGYIQVEMIARYEAILQKIKEKIPQIQIYLLAYFPVNPDTSNIAWMAETFRNRTNTRIRAANEAVRELAEKYGARFVDFNRGITDGDGQLKAQYTIDGIHMYADGYNQVMEQLLPILKSLQ